LYFDLEKVSLLKVICKLGFPEFLLFPFELECCALATEMKFKITSNRIEWNRIECGWVPKTNYCADWGSNVI